MTGYEMPILSNGKYILRGTAFVLLALVFAALIRGYICGYFIGMDVGKAEMQEELVKKGYGSWHKTAIKERTEFQWHDQK